MGYRPIAYSLPKVPEVPQPQPQRQDNDLDQVPAPLVQRPAESSLLKGPKGRETAPVGRAALQLMHGVLRSSYNGFMSLLQIRDVPDETRRALKARAAASGRSLNAYLLDLLRREVARPSVSEVLERAARRAERSTASALTALQAARDERQEVVGGPASR